VFRQEKVDVEEIFTLAQLNAWAWMKYKIGKVNFSYSDLDSLSNSVPSFYYLET